MSVRQPSEKWFSSIAEVERDRLHKFNELVAAVSKSLIIGQPVYWARRLVVDTFWEYEYARRRVREALRRGDLAGAYAEVIMIAHWHNGAGATMLRPFSCPYSPECVERGVLGSPYTVSCIPVRPRDRSRAR
jgi:hypothetical protein